MAGSTNNKRAAPWAIRNVTLEARNAAIAAARREGLTLGEWMDRAIRQQVKADRNQVPALTLEDTLAKLVESMDRQNARFEAVERSVGALQGAQVSRSGNILTRLYGLLWGKEGHQNGDASSQQP